MKVRDVHHAKRRHDELKSHHIEPHRHDSYKARGKLADPTVCPQCGAIFSEGRWQWLDERPEGASEEVCPACHRGNDKYPAGEIILSGSFLSAHQKDILALISNIQAQQSAEHPMSRVMSISQSNGTVVVSTTDIHLPRRIGHALEHAFKGELDTHYNEAEYFVKVRWHRDS